MANRTYLLNTAILGSDPYLLRAKLAESGNDYVEVAEASYRIPIPWLCCFRKEDMRPVTVPVQNWETGAETSEVVALPCTTVKQALLNLTRAAPLFESIAGDARIGRAYWLDAVAGLRGLPLPYLTMDPIEVMYMDDPADYERSLVAALGSEESCIPHLKELSGYDDRALPYGPDVLTVVASGKHHRGRLDSAVALHGGIGWEHGFWHLSAGSTKADMPAGRPQPPKQAADLESIDAELTALAKARCRSARISFGFVPTDAAPRERLKLCVWTDTDAEQAALQNDREFRAELDALADTTLRSVCAGHGFDWVGYAFQSMETTQRAAKPDYDAWLR